MSGRATQLDGLRALALLGVAWFHWTPASWQAGLPWPVGIYYFYALSGYLITAGLLRDREQGEGTGGAWRGPAMGRFLWRRSLRILVPYYAAVLLAWLLPSVDLPAHPWWYLLHVSNWHVAFSGWPDYTSHFWTLAVLQQFYLAWPWLVWWLPRSWLAPALCGLSLVGPLTRVLEPWTAQWFQVPGAITPAQMDFLALGALLAVWVRRGMPLDHPWLIRAAWLGAAGYAGLYAYGKLGHGSSWVGAAELFALAVACCGLVAGGARGFRSPVGAVLDHPWLQHLGRISYSFYLFHNLAPALDWVLGFCQLSWTLQGAGLLVRLPVLFAGSWGVAWLSWRYLELPLGKFATRPR